MAVADGRDRASLDGHFEAVGRPHEIQKRRFAAKFPGRPVDQAVEDAPAVSAEDVGQHDPDADAGPVEHLEPWTRGKTHRARAGREFSVVPPPPLLCHCHNRSLPALTNFMPSGWSREAWP